MATDAITAYQSNDNYAGLRFFAWDLNDILVAGGAKSAEIDQAIAELDNAINDSTKAHSSCDNLVLYRGCTFKKGNPEIRHDKFNFRQYLSTSTNLSNALGFASKCDPNDGDVYMLKIVYPRNKSHFEMRENSENEILLPRNCAFKYRDWNLAGSEELIWGLNSSIRLIGKVNRFELVT